MKKIKFSHEYCKLPTDFQDGAILFAVFRTHYNKLGEDFITYDTNYPTDDGHGGPHIANYKLPKTDLLVLLFATPCLDIFTTIRRWTPQKEKYYRLAIGEEFEVVIKK